MPKMPVIVLRFDCAFGIPMPAGWQVEWRDANWIDAVLVLGAVAAVALKA